MKNSITEFIKTVKNYYSDNYRPMEWRDTIEPYYVLVSEIMLQQTQVNRVKEKFAEFIKKFPTIDDLAKAELDEVIATWSGLGYNRRAIFLKKAAEQICSKHDSKIPDDHTLLTDLPGIGKATASAILVYAYNKPEVYIETNIRTVFIYHFFPDSETVTDDELMPFIEETVDETNPREWYWALMDYGTHLKKTVGNLSRKSKSYTKQSKFEGSKRQKRGLILKTLLNTPKLTIEEVANTINTQTDEASEISKQLVKEGFIEYNNKHYSLKK